MAVHFGPESVSSLGRNTQWVLVAAALKAQRLDLATHAYEVALKRLSHDDWPEYYDTLGGRFIGLRANRKQVW